MRPPEDDVLLADMLDHARKAERAVRDRRREDLESDDRPAARSFYRSMWKCATAASGRRTPAR